MIGILLMSHGEMAKGMLDSSKLFFGEPEKMEALCLMPSDNPEEFDDRIRNAAEALDDGSGIIAFCDLLGGTPSNRSMYVILENPRIKVITGMNFPMLLELLGRRMFTENIDDLDLSEIIEVGQNGIVCLNDVVSEVQG